MGRQKGNHGTPGDTTVASVVTSLTNTSVEAGQEFTITATAKNAEGAALTGKVFTAVSSDTSVVRVLSVSGQTITLVAGSSAPATATVTVTCNTVNAPAVTVATTLTLASLQITPTTSQLLTIGGSVQVSIAGANRFGLSVRVPTFVGLTTNAGIATIAPSATGFALITAVGQGTASVSAQAGTVVSNSISVGVAQAPQTLVPTSYGVTVDNYAPAADGTITARAQLLDQNGAPFAMAGQTVTWSKDVSDGSFAAATSVTDGSGVATVAYTVGAGESSHVTATDFAGRTGTSPIIAAAPAGGGGSPANPNEPVGSTELAQTPFDSLDGAEISAGTNRANVAIFVDATSPEGDTNVGQLKFPAGFPSGIAPGGFYPNNPFSFKPKRLYVRFWVKLSANWVGNAAGANKICYVQLDQQNRGSIEFIAMGGIDDTEQTIAPMIVLENVNVVPGQGSSGTPSATLVPNRVPYQASSAYQRGTWGLYETEMWLNSAPGVADGGIRWWWNKQLYGDFSGVVDWNIAGPSSAFSNAYWEPTYGGAGPAVPADQYMWMKGLYISGKAA